MRGRHPRRSTRDRLPGKPAALVALTLLLACGCLRMLDPDYECVNECLVGNTGCVENSTAYCVIEPLFGCMVWFPDVNCDDRQATCIDAGCICDPGMVPCPPDGICCVPEPDPGVGNTHLSGSTIPRI